MGGFAPDYSAVPSQFCRQDDFVTVTVEEGDIGTRLHYYYHRRREGEISCQGEVPRSPDPGPLGDLVFPRLTAPKSTEHNPSFRSIGAAQRSTATFLRTDLSAVEVLDHYSSQLSELGWLPVAACWDGPVAVKAWQVDMGAEEPLSGLLLVNRRGETTDVVLSVSRGSGVLESPPATVQH